MRITEHSRLKDFNTFGIDAHADCIVEWSSVQELQAILPELDRPILPIGQGSNLLFMNDFHGTILKSAIQSVDILHKSDDHVLVRAGSGVIWDDFVSLAVMKGWWGVENLTAIPGQVGAAAVQNIGAYGAEAKDVIETVQTVCLADGSTRDFNVSECGYSYRQSIFKKELIHQYAVSHVIFDLGLKSAPKLGYGALEQEVMRLGEPTLNNISSAVRNIRDSKLPDPAVLGNAGSFFMNPVIPSSQYESLKSKYPDIPSYAAGNDMVKVPAGWLIDHAGWKGRALGPAAVYERQALVLVNTGGATGQDIKALADAIIADVREKYSITLSTEVNYI